MSLRSFIAARVSQRLTSEDRVLKSRAQADRQRKSRGEACMVDYFHDASDPYAHLTAQVLPLLLDRYDIEITPHLVPPPPDWAAPDREKLIGYSRLDAARLAAKARLDFADPGGQPPEGRLKIAEAAFARLIETADFAAKAAAIGHWLWTGEGQSPEAGGDADAAKAAGASAREARGHYLAATFHLDGEWFWGIDRLHYLEARLAEAGRRRPGAPDGPIFAPPPILADPPSNPTGAPELHYYLSFRSPYTAIVAGRVKALADAYGAELKLRYVLPMVMRGMQVPRTKGMYIIKDTAREARRLDVPFGKIADPVGEPVERGYAILPHAIEQGKGYEFTASFLRGVWAEGIDAGSDSGLKTITERAGLDWKTAKALIGGDHWREQEAKNQAEMLTLGIWGVPSFRVGETSAWGQDRLWVIEDALREAQKPA